MADDVNTLPHCQEDVQSSVPCSEATNPAGREGALTFTTNTIGRGLRLFCTKRNPGKGTSECLDLLGVAKPHKLINGKAGIA